MATEGKDPSYLLGVEASTLQRYRLFDEIYRPGTLQRLSELRLPSHAEVLEIGCGIGETACYFARHVVPNGHVTAFDQAEDLIEIAIRRADELGITNVTFICSDAQSFEYEAERFDFAHTRYVLSYLQDPRDILVKTHGALKPSGVFLGEEIAQLYIRLGPTDWYENMSTWFARLIEAGGGDPDYGLKRLPTDMLDAGLGDLSATAYWPMEDQQKLVDMLRIALSQEMKNNLVRLGLTTAAEVDDVISQLAKPDRDYIISAAVVLQVLGHKA